MPARKMILATAVALLMTLALPGLALEDRTGISPRLANALENGGPIAKSSDGTFAVWVRFADKDLNDLETASALKTAESSLSAAAISRRTSKSLSGLVVEEGDLPLAERYLVEVSATGATARRQSRWLNAASYNATRSQIETISRLPFVASVDLVARGVGEHPALNQEASAELESLLAAAETEKVFGELDYGASGPGLSQMNINEAHAQGLSGQGVTVALFDTGFQLDHESLTNVDVLATWDFINDSDYVGPREGDDTYQTIYGTAALSVLAGFSRSNLIGSAYNASVVLAKTEDLSSETPAEEDNWIAALEWAEGLGVDIVSSGLGYYYWYTYDDMDGQTAAITVAAEMAAARGVCVVNATGDLRGSQDWPHLLPPSDGRSVIAVGTVDFNNQVAYFSSPGPTADGRIKPDVMAPGYGIPVATSFMDDLYNYGVGSNYSVPLVSGLIALMLENNPSLNPTQIMEALHMTSSRSGLPDNDFGWGTPDALAATSYWSPSIAHTPLNDREIGLGLHPVSATITDRVGLDMERLYVSYRVDGGHWQLTAMTSDGGDGFTGLIPQQGYQNEQIDYYIAATSTTGNTSLHPADSPSSFHSFVEGVDTTPPVIEHVGLANMVLAHWPPSLRVEATDNKGIDNVKVQLTVPGQGTLGPFTMIDMGDHHELEIPIPVETLYPGIPISYIFMATDTATVPNSGISGPYDFKIVSSKGSVLVVDDRNNTKGTIVGDRKGSELDPPTDKSVGDLALWLMGAGFTADTMDASDVKSSSFLGYDAVMVSSGSNFAPYAYGSLRRSMAVWVENGGKLIVEGGETAYAAAVTPGYPDIMGNVLPISGYAGDDAARLYAPAELADLPLLHRPHRLTMPLTVDNSGGLDWGATDLAVKTPEAFVALHAGFGTSRGGLIIHDNNTGVESGQIAYLTFDIMKAGGTAGRALLDNVMTYLLTEEPPGTASISGKVTLAGMTDHSGVTVRAGLTHRTMTAADGTYTLSGLWGGEYNIIVEGEGYAPVSRRVSAVDDMVTTGTDFYLIPVTEVSYTSSPGLSIPDNNPDGLTDTIDISEGGLIYGLTVDGDISHFAIGQLVIKLTSPSGTEVTLHNRTGGTSDDLVGTWPTSLFVDGPGELTDILSEQAAGTWTLNVSDRQLGALGTLNAWTLNLLVQSSGASPVDDNLPNVTQLVGNAPNPFNPRTKISFDLAAAGPVRLDIFDVRGRLVRLLANGDLPAGRHSLLWDGRNESGGETASGLYFYRLTAAGQQQTNKMLLVR
jgi:subtilisin-like proprotein convertase family protein